MKDSPRFDGRTIWAPRVLHTLLEDLAARAPTRSLTRVRISAAIGLADGEGIGVQELSAKLLIPTATVSHVVTELINDGVVGQCEDASDGRRYRCDHLLNSVVLGA